MDSEEVLAIDGRLKAMIWNLEVRVFCEFLYWMVKLLPPLKMSLMHSAKDHS